MPLAEALVALSLGTFAPAADAQPAEPKPGLPVSAQLRSGIISQTDYPASALGERAEGVAIVRYQIGEEGRVVKCIVERSSGNSALDSTTCSLVQRRFRFRPALDASGNPVSEWRTQRVAWRLPAGTASLSGEEPARD